MKNVTLLTALCMPTALKLSPIYRPLDCTVEAHNLALKICAQTDENPNDQVEVDHAVFNALHRGIKDIRDH